MNTSLAQRFEADGYLVLENAIPAAQLQAIRGAAQAIVADFDIDRHRSVFSTRDRDRGRDRYFADSAEAIHCFLEEDALDTSGQLKCEKSLAINKIGHALHDLDPAFEAFCRQPLFADLLRQLGYQRPRLWQSMYIFKQPRIGGEVRWHQDASYLISEPASVTGFWVAVEDAHLGNGCLWVQPGGHHSPLRDRFEFDHQAMQGELLSVGNTPWPGDKEGLALQVPAGSVVIFSDHMPHYSSANHSDASRHAFTMHFAEASAHWPEVNWLQRRQLPPFDLY